LKIILLNLAFKVYSDDNLWVGYNDRESEGDWTWTDKMTSSYTNWNEASPNNGGVSCALVTPTSGSWRDESCKKTHDFICKKGNLVIVLRLSYSNISWRIV
jgi:hypothetical protein